MCDCVNLHVQGLGGPYTNSLPMLVFFARSERDAASSILFSFSWERCRMCLKVIPDLRSELSKSAHPLCGLCRLRGPSVVINALPSTEVYDSLL